MAIAVGDLFTALQFLVILVLDAEGAADVVDDVLIRSRVVAARRFIADRFGGLPVGIDITRRESGAGAGVLGELFLQLGAA